MAMQSRRTKSVALCGIMTAVAMIFSYIESLFPIPVPVYGVKLGIANIAIITVLLVVGTYEAIAVNVIRIMLTAVLFGNFNTFLFSIAGGVLSLAVMIILKKSKKFSTIGISVAGGVFHNIGQTAAAVFVMDTTAIVFYLPVLLIAGIVTGTVIGIVSGIVVRSVKKVV